MTPLEKGKYCTGKTNPLRTTYINVLQNRIQGPCRHPAREVGAKEAGYLRVRLHLQFAGNGGVVEGGCGVCSLYVFEMLEWRHALGDHHLHQSVEILFFFLVEVRVRSCLLAVCLVGVVGGKALLGIVATVAIGCGDVTAESRLCVVLLGRTSF